ncbi:MAG: nucleoside hydrolase [Spirochaetaceae bacterium]|nr:MAG: nucleoside hydrolase [Spirochaetaceae bacterium]
MIETSGMGPRAAPPLPVKSELRYHTLGWRGPNVSTPFIIDTDCGIDDAVAILMALLHPEVDVVGVSTLSGNVARDQVTQNVCELLASVGRGEIPVFAGATRPLLREPVSAKRIHGPTGLGLVELPATSKAAEDADAPTGIARMVREYPGATVVALGPLTNLALTLNLYPDVVSGIGSLVIMGGALGDGNVTRFAEFNFYADPEAVDVVFRSGVPCTIVPWDACRSVRLDREQLAAAVGNQTHRGELVQRLQEWVFRAMEERLGMPFAAMADPIAMAVAMEPRVIAAHHDGNLRMELGCTTMRGASVRWDGGGMDIVDAIDIAAFSSLLQKLFILPTA